MQDRFNTLLEAITLNEDKGLTSLEAVESTQGVLSEDVPWDPVDLNKLPSHVKKVASSLHGANGAKLSRVYRHGGDYKLVFSRPGGLYLNKYNMQKIVKVLGRDEDVLGDSTRNGFVVVLH